jgi:hypothetical protein
MESTPSGDSSAGASASMFWSIFCIVSISVRCEELGLNCTRVRGWGLSQAVLAAYWSFEDGGDGAGVVDELKPCARCIVIPGRTEGTGEGGPA